MLGSGQVGWRVGQGTKIEPNSHPSATLCKQLLAVAARRQHFAKRVADSYCWQCGDSVSTKKDLLLASVAVLLLAIANDSYSCTS